MTAQNDPNAIIDIEWDERFDWILDELNERIKRRGKAGTLNIRMVARALLTLLRSGDLPTAMDVVDYVYNNDTPDSGFWIDFDYAKWLEYVPRVVETLKSLQPEDILGR